MENCVDIWHLFGCYCLLCILMLSWKLPPNVLVTRLRCGLSVLFSWVTVSGPQLLGSSPVPPEVPTAVGKVCADLSNLDFNFFLLRGGSHSSWEFLPLPVSQGGLGGEGVRKKTPLVGEQSKGEAKSREDPEGPKDAVNPNDSWLGSYWCDGLDKLNFQDMGKLVFSSVM